LQAKSLRWKTLLLRLLASALSRKGSASNAEAQGALAATCSTVDTWLTTGVIAAMGATAVTRCTLLAAARGLCNLRQWRVPTWLHGYLATPQAEAALALMALPGAALCLTREGIHTPVNWVACDLRACAVPL
jgi:hypothetical protein